MTPQEWDQKPLVERGALFHDVFTARKSFEYLGNTYVGESNYYTSRICIYADVDDQHLSDSKVIWKGSDEEFVEFIGSFSEYLLMKVKSIVK